MRKFLVAFLLFPAFVSFHLNAQNCVPGSYPSHGVYPDSVTGLPPAYVNTLYSEVVTVIVPPDTTLDIGLGPMYFSIDSIGITNVTGMPPGFTFSGNPANGFIHGNAAGCVLITGTPGIADVGSYPITITFESWVNNLAQGFVDNQTYYTIHVLDTLVYISDDNSELQKPFNYPNPFSDGTSIRFHAASAQNVSISIYNHLGQLSFTDNFSTVSGINEYSLTLDANEGIYYYIISGQNFKLSNKLFKKN